MIIVFTPIRFTPQIALMAVIMATVFAAVVTVVFRPQVLERVACARVRSNVLPGTASALIQQIDDASGAAHRVCRSWSPFDWDGYNTVVVQVEGVNLSQSVRRTRWQLAVDPCRRALGAIAVTFGDRSGSPQVLTWDGSAVSCHPADNEIAVTDGATYYVFTDNNQSVAPIVPQ